MLPLGTTGFNGDGIFQLNEIYRGVWLKNLGEKQMGNNILLQVLV